MSRFFRTTLLVATLMAAAPLARAQDPGFQGTWAMDTARSESAKQATPIAPVTLVVSMTPTDLNIERRQGTDSRTVRYQLNGADTVTSWGQDSATGHVSPDGVNLTTDTVYQVKGVPLRQTETRSLSSDGREMTVETALVVVHGYEGQRANDREVDPNVSKVKDVYVRR